jgi:hypothetical protein
MHDMTVIRNLCVRYACSACNTVHTYVYVAHNRKKVELRAGSQVMSTFTIDGTVAELTPEEG